LRARRRAAFAALVLLIVAPAGFAADTQPYSISLASTGNDSLDEALQASSQLDSLRKSAPVSAFALIGRARDDAERLKTVLESFGYYHGEVRIAILGKPLEDPELPDAIAALPAGRDAAVTAAFQLGPLYRLRTISVDAELTPSERRALGLEPRDNATAVHVLDGRVRLLNALQEEGYAFASVDVPVAYEIPDEAALDVSFHVVRGEPAAIGAIALSGLKGVHESFVRARLKLRTGDLFNPRRLEDARRDLLGLGVFNSVTMKLGDRPDADGRVPLTIVLVERLRHTLGFNAGYSSDLGGSAGVRWSNRNTFGNGEQLNLAATALELGGHATTGVGYNITAQLVKPDIGARDQNLQFNVGTLKQSLQAYDQTAVTASTLLTHRFTPTWVGSIGVSGEREQITQETLIYDYTLLGLPIAAKYNGTGLVNPLEDPLHGLRASFSVTPTRALTAIPSTFIVAQADAAAYFDVNGLGWTPPGRSVIAVRGLIGQVRGAAPFDLPPDQRFYGGGSGTIRGFRYQSVGPQFTDGNPKGGTAVDAATVEFRQRIARQFGAAVFVDAGATSADGHPLQGRPSIGVGLGGRYYTAIGPIRVDVAVPVTRLPGGDSFEIYIGLGQVF
jgi:translocation and assembly module TamA